MIISIIRTMDKISKISAIALKNRLRGWVIGRYENRQFIEPFYAIMFKQIDEWVDEMNKRSNN